MQEVLHEDPLVAVLPAGHLLLGAKVLARLTEEPFLLYPSAPRPGYADHLLALFAR
ncbi:hypothetical protein [Pseudomonas oryzihabitans]|uniref:hypothetical protein n=1 Tax=Pseudomonas oryzihabitans TaxID=47885 RepID=UPI00391752EF